MDDLTKCLYCKGRGYLIRWIACERITDPLCIREACPRCNGTGRMTTLLQTVPRNPFHPSSHAKRFPCITDAKV